MKIKVLDVENKETGSIDLPSQFNEEIRVDLVRRAVCAIHSNTRQKYGADPKAGLRHSTRVSKRRRDYRGCYGQGISRMPRKIMSRRGTRINWTGARSPGTVGGRRAHPPKAEKEWSLKINKKERRKAIRCGLSATMEKNLVKGRGHKAPESYPFIIEDSFENITKTKDFVKALENLGLSDELRRAETKTIRAGIGKTRGRKYKRKKSFLIVVKDECALLKAANSIAGADVVTINNVNAELLAPGGDVGRLSLFTKGAIEKMEKEKLFM